MDNLLLKKSGLPNFSDYKTDLIEEAIDEIISSNQVKLDNLLKSEKVHTWENLVQPLEEMEEFLSRVWSPASHMNSVVNSDGLRDAYNACLPKLTEYSTELGQNSELFNAYKSIAESDEFSSFSLAQKKTIENELRGFRLSGVDLPDEEKKEYKRLSKNLTKLTTKYEENLLDATNAWKKHVLDEALLVGLPQSALDLAAQTAKQKGLEGYLLTLQFPSYYAVMTYADNRDLREELYRAYCTRASELGADLALDNSNIMSSILETRRQLAGLLGFNNYAERSLETKMASSAEKVLVFLRDLSDRTKAQAEGELEQLQQFASDELDIKSISAWDIGYASEKLQMKLFTLSQEDLKPYFPIDKVIDGLFDLVKSLYQVDIKEKKGVETWHPEVRFYELFDSKGILKAQFYFDLYARENKRGGAWMDVCLSRMKTELGVQIPVAYMTCNSSPPVNDTPALFTHDEVITLFHEFGHGLHHMLTDVDYPSVSGIAGVEWDAVELPSQFMENWCWEENALKAIAGHFETGEALPQKLYESLLASKHFQAAMQTLRQVEFAIFDLRIHMENKQGDSSEAIQNILNEVRNEISVLSPPHYNRFQNGFSHIFAGGYAAGYYSYKWAEVLSADVFARFEEEGLYSKKVGGDFLEQILSMGGSRSAMENFIAFRGREPTIDALLRHNGLTA